jgi:hypothetical protein
MTDRTGAPGATPVAGILAGQARKPSEASKVIRRKTSLRFANGFLGDSLPLASPLGQGPRPDRVRHDCEPAKWRCPRPGTGPMIPARSKGTSSSETLTGDPCPVLVPGFGPKVHSLGDPGGPAHSSHFISSSLAETKPKASCDCSSSGMRYSSSVNQRVVFLTFSYVLMVRSGFTLPTSASIRMAL